MKHFEPIVIQELNDMYNQLRIEPARPNLDDVIDIVVEDSRRAKVTIGLSHQAAIRLRDALNTILND